MQEIQLYGRSSYFMILQRLSGKPVGIQPITMSCMVGFQNYMCLARTLDACKDHVISFKGQGQSANIYICEFYENRFMMCLCQRFDCKINVSHLDLYFMVP